MSRLTLIVLAWLALAPAARAEPWPETLSATGLYDDIAAKTIAPGARYYEPQYPLWSDGARKRRWIRLPPGTKIDSMDLDYWKFPVGTKVWKEFRFPAEPGSDEWRRVETRYMEKIPDGRWFIASYLWNADESEATRASVYGVPNYYPLGDGVYHSIPAAMECRFCHARGGDLVLSFDALQLSDDRDLGMFPRAPLPFGAVVLSTLGVEGLLTRFPPEWYARPPRIHAATRTGRTAMGYLHGNCGHCHNPTGRAAFTGQFLRHEVGAEDEAHEPAFATTVDRLTTRYQLPGHTATKRIEPGDPDESAVYYRMTVVGKDQMPPVGRKTVDDWSVQLLSRWIESLGN